MRVQPGDLRCLQQGGSAPLDFRNLLYHRGLWLMCCVDWRSWTTCPAVGAS